MWCGGQHGRGDIAVRHAATAAGRSSDPASDRAVERPEGHVAAGERIDAVARDGAAEEVRAAYVDGLLGVDELERALGDVYAARTGGDLAAATALVPAWWRHERDAARRRARGEQLHRLVWRRNVEVYLAVMALLVAIWLMTAPAGGGHPWPLWPALGWGVPLLASRPRPERSAAARGV